MKFGFYREKKVMCGRILDVSIFPYTYKQGECVKGKRSKLRKESAPKQKNLNEKNSIRYFVQLVNTNFHNDGFHITLTYRNKYLPKTTKALYKEAVNFIRRLKYQVKKRKLPELKYILVTEYGEKEDGELTRPHHHIIIKDTISLALVESCWTKKKRGQRTGESLGIVRSSRLQPDESGLTGLAQYLSKQPSRKKRWSSSQNLKKPVSRTNDNKYRRREVERLSKNIDDVQYWEKKYPGYTLVRNGSLEADYNEFTGWSIYVQLRKLE